MRTGKRSSVSLAAVCCTTCLPLGASGNSFTNQFPAGPSPVAYDVKPFGGLSTASISKLYAAICAMAVEPTRSRTTIQHFRFIPPLAQRTFIILGYNEMGVTMRFHFRLLAVLPL